MVTLRNSGPDMDTDALIMTYNCSGEGDADMEADPDSDTSVTVYHSNEDEICGVPRAVPRAILTSRKNSHFFQERILNLEQPVKIGRSVARTRPSPINGIFDCKVLSRNHALMWYENERFYIEDTKSSNGTFVNSQRLNRMTDDGGSGAAGNMLATTNQPQEIWSGDVVQFGVDVLENQRKGNSANDNSDDLVHIVTHGCIVATLKLIHPNGKEAKPSLVQTNTNGPESYPQEDICKLQLIIFEAQQREERLHNKLEELHMVISTLQDSCHDTLNVRFEETRLLSKIENHEKRAKVMKKLQPSSMDAAEIDMVHQLLRDVEKVQSVSQEIQERLHRQLIESEDSLSIARQDATNLHLEVQSLQDLALRSETNVQEIAAKCTNYVQTIESLEAKLKAQTKKLECRVESTDNQEDSTKFLTQSSNQKNNESNDEWADVDLLPKLSREHPVILEWYDKCYPILKNRINEEDSWKIIRRLLEVNVSDMELSRSVCEKLLADKQDVLLKITEARAPHVLPKVEHFSNEDNVVNNEDAPLTEINLNQSDMDSNYCKSSIQLQDELKEIDESLEEAIWKKTFLEGRCGGIKSILDSAMLSAEKKPPLLVEKTDCEDSEMTVEHIRQLVETLRTETQKKDKSYEKLILSKRADEGTQTDRSVMYSKETSTEQELGKGIEEKDNYEVSDSAILTANPSDVPNSCPLDGHATIRRGRSKDMKRLLLSPAPMNSLDQSNLVQETSVGEKQDDNHEKNRLLDDMLVEEEFVAHEEDSLTSPNSSVETDTNAINDAIDRIFCENGDNLDGGQVNDTTDSMDCSKEDNVKEAVQDSEEATKRFEELVASLDNECQQQNIAMWTNVRGIHNVCDHILQHEPESASKLTHIKHLLNLVSEDLVALLVKEQVLAVEQKRLQETVSHSISQADVAALSLADRFWALVIGFIICYIGSRLLAYLGVEA